MTHGDVIVNGGGRSADLPASGEEVASDLLSGGVECLQLPLSTVQTLVPQLEKRMCSVMVGEDHQLRELFP